ncbi:unnamed protein product [Acanthoscelides obtectus]|uniref:PiggyBac transposable element-derived protein domain-containing protein n=1 Tax=Acanthoscelides obtectus TaxID=200917 RepID=A0A9P0PVU7_ACAOB|nr:unnamed protein product [Acanthoscelides obtectus]CAK1675530.1 hypothetical protein AOBTE_LOCUS30279 [Acanthoscelides obtectus]
MLNYLRITVRIWHKSIIPGNVTPSQRGIVKFYENLQMVVKKQLMLKLVNFDLQNYNLTKGGVDVVDKMKSEYSAARFSNRWPYTVFCGLLNISTINSQIIYRENTNNIITRRQFISELSKLLVMPHLYRRSQIPGLPYLLSQKIRNTTEERPTPKRDQATQAKVRCEFCPLRKNRVFFNSRGFQNETSEEETFSSEILDEEFSVFR